MAEDNSSSLRPILNLMENIGYRVKHVGSENIDIDELDQLRTGLQDVVHNLNQMRNKMAAISRLPNELLCRVFGFAIDDAIPLGRVMLLIITSTCHHWRSIAIQNGAFWSEIDINSGDVRSIECASAFLTRSQGTALELHLECSNSPLNNLLDLLGQLSRNSFRIKRFSIYCDHAIPLLNAMQFPLLNLEVLELKPRYDIIPTPLPSLFGGQFPKLKVLDLVGYTSWPAGQFKNLTTISLCSESEAPFDGSSLMDLLQDSPALVILKLENVGPDKNRPISPRSIPLPELQLLVMRHCRSPVILSHLTLSSQTQLQIDDCFLCDEQVGVIPESLTILSVILPTQYPSFEVEHARIEFQEVSLSVLAWNSGSPDTGIAIEQDVVDFSPDSYNLVLRTLRDLTSKSIFRKIKTLELSLECEVGWLEQFGEEQQRDLRKSEWGEFFDQLPQLQELSLQLTQNRNILQTLTENRPNGTLRCQNLQTLNVDASFAALEEGESALVTLQLVSDLLQARANGGLKLRKLTLHRCELIPGEKRDWERLEELAEELKLS